MRFTLAIDSRGRVLISTPERLTDAQITALRVAFKEWEDAEPPEALIVHECDVVRVTDIQLELEPAGSR